MRKPIDPRHNGLKEPKRVHSVSTALYLADLDQDGKVTLRSVINAWAKAVREHESQGHRIKEEPHFDSGSYYGRSVSLSYTYEWDNLNYVKENTEWHAAVTEYQTKMIAWNKYEEERKNALMMGTKNIDAQIERAEHRLANLKARKAGEPIPYPES